MKLRIVYIFLTISAFLFGFAFYFSLIYFPFSLFLPSHENKIATVATCICILIVIINFRTIFRLMNRFTYHFLGYRFD